MGDVLKVCKMAQAVRTFKASQVIMNHKMRKQVQTIFLFIIILNRITLSLCFHDSNYHIALYNLFMHSSLTNQKQDILLSIEEIALSYETYYAQVCILTKCYL